MSYDPFWAWLLGVEANLESIDSIRPAFAQPWAGERPMLVVLLAVAALALSTWFYLRTQRRGSTAARLGLALARGALIATLLAILGDPVLRVAYTHRPRPLLYLVMDGTDSMAIADELTQPQVADLDHATGRAPDVSESKGLKPSRMDYVRALITKSDENLLSRLEEKFRLRAFLMRRRDGVEGLSTTSTAAEQMDAAALAEKLTTDGQVTNLSAALEDLHSRHATSRLAGVVMISDFDQNAGPPPVGEADSAAVRLGVPIYTVGVGPASAVDLKVDLIVPPVMKKAERRTVAAVLEQQGLGGNMVTVRFSTRRLREDDDGTAAGEGREIGRRTVKLQSQFVPIDPIEFVPSEAGQFEIVADVTPLEQETITRNNRATRKVQILDDFLRLLFIEYEPTWEWRFIKEVFHRDRLVGLKGFRTYLHSADPKVKQSKELFTASLTPRTRSEFFSNDVVFLGDIPAQMLTKAFCDRLEEFVGTFGGGLVIIGGPRFGPGQFAQTAANPEMDQALKKLRNMLPVEVDPAGRPKESPFQFRLTALGRQTEFMRLPESDRPDGGAWTNLGTLPWYQPVRRPHRLARVLAEHPSDPCPDEPQTNQPLVAIRPYGKGQVVYLGFNETWRLRRKHGELYYRQFWGQLIHQLGLSHALGADKRFIARLDSDQGRYQAGEQVTLTVEAYDEDFKELDEQKYRKLDARLHRPDRSQSNGMGEPGANDAYEEFNVPQLRSGVFEARLPVFGEGTYRIEVKDPVTGRWKPPITFQVASRAAERRSAVRNVPLQTAISQATGGKAYDLLTVDRLPDEITASAKPQTTIEVHKLWTTTGCFILVLALMLGEWTARKMIHLA